METVKANILANVALSCYRRARHSTEGELTTNIEFICSQSWLIVIELYFSGIFEVQVYRYAVIALSLFSASLPKLGVRIKFRDDFSYKSRTFFRNTL